jgi:6-phosphogluconolactonase (cycloisomerase 2 family)
MPRRCQGPRQEDREGAVASFGLDPRTGKLTNFNRHSTVGDGPCHLLFDATGNNVLVANDAGRPGVQESKG